MKLLHLRPLLWVPDVRAASDWYIATLGFSELESSEDWQWASLGRDGVELMLARPPAHMPYSGPLFTGSFYFNTRDAAAWWERLKDDCEIVYPIETFPWGMREFAIRDLNGFILQFGQEQPS
ncbi:VOC family protein [Flaviaesturariibacter aridisoli]|uniref:Bleomycin resistance family protein n=1 Tax=Flaviaesturariibacter aridisoli TaxID=2545761 RepID=A0A4R4DWP3_9BACT|nr:VOC family protein [Flaviaesturariibacter aridisoli]TCZ65270.1 bleomycin resistance family protein [Flaviaesturariibacter aridisoli]